MSIRNGIDTLTQIFPAQAAQEAASARNVHPAQGESPTSDSAQLSAVAAQAVQTAAASDVRMDKVASIQSALQAGTYQVPAEDVAQKIIASMLPGTSQSQEK